MSFAVIQTGGKQYKVKASDILKIEKLKNSKPESKVEFNEVLAYGDDKTLAATFTYQNVLGINFNDNF